MKEILSFPVFTPTSNIIPTEIWNKFRIREKEENLYFPYTTINDNLAGWKVRDKKNYKVKDTLGKDFTPYNWFNVKNLVTKTLYIVDNEIELLSLQSIFYILNKNTKYSQIEYAIIGSNSRDEIGKVLGEIENRWEQIVLIPTKADSSIQNFKSIATLFKQHMIATIPSTSIYECLRKGLLKATNASIIFKAYSPLPSSLVNKDDLLESLDDENEMGLSLPWPTVTQMVYGMKRGEIMSIGGTEGGGKTTLARQICEYSITKHNWNVLTLFLEETPRQTLYRIASVHDKLPYYNPIFCSKDPRFDSDKFKATCKKLLPYLEFWNRKEQAFNPNETWEGIKTLIRQIGDKIDQLILDNLTVISEGLSASERNDFLGVLCSDLSKLSAQFNFHTVLLSHLNPAKSSVQHEVGGKVLKSDFTGSRAAAKYSHVVIGFERNMQAVDPNCSIIRILKSREGGKTGPVKTKYDSNSCQILESYWDDELYETKEVVKKKGKQ